MQNIEIENVEPSTMATLLERTEMSIPENKISNEKKPEKVKAVYLCIMRYWLNIINNTAIYEILY